MTYIEFLDTVRLDLMENLNTFLTENYGLEPIENFCVNGFEVVRNPLSLAVYGSTPQGSVFAQGSASISAKATIEFFLTDSADEASVERIEKYFSAIADYLTKHTYGEYSLISDSQLSRMDVGDQCNEALFLVDARIQTTPDEYFG